MAAEAGGRAHRASRLRPACRLLESRRDNHRRFGQSAHLRRCGVRRHPRCRDEPRSGHKRDGPPVGLQRFRTDSAACRFGTSGTESHVAGIHRMVRSVDYMVGGQARDHGKDRANARNSPDGHHAVPQRCRQSRAARSTDSGCDRAPPSPMRSIRRHRYNRRGCDIGRIEAWSAHSGRYCRRVGGRRSGDMRKLRTDAVEHPAELPSARCVRRAPSRRRHDREVHPRGKGRSSSARTRSPCLDEQNGNLRQKGTGGSRGHPSRRVRRYNAGGSRREVRSLAPDGRAEIQGCHGENDRRSDSRAAAVCRLRLSEGGKILHFGHR